MNEELLRQGFKDLNSLASIEYHESLAELLEDSDANRSSTRLGRLVGVMLKEPFARSIDLQSPSYRSAAYRSWELKDRPEFESHDSTWQYRALDQIRIDLSLQHMTVYDLAYDAHYEQGFFGYLARDLRNYLCGEKVLRKKVAAALKSAGAISGKLPQVTPEAIVGAGGLSLGALLVQNVPVLGMVGAPVIAAIVVILYRLGIESFCTWTASLQIGDDEKH